jgi:hypothetical protein
MTDGPSWKECMEERRLCRTEIFGEINRIAGEAEEKSSERHKEVMSAVKELQTARDITAGREAERETTAHKPVGSSFWGGAAKQVVITVISTILTTSLLGGLLYALLNHVGG